MIVGVPLALIAAFMFGAQPLLQKHALKDVSPQTLLVLSDLFYLVCIIFFTLINYKIIKKDITDMNRNTWVIIACSAMIFSFLGFMAYVYAIKFSSPHVAAAIVASSPLFTVLISTIFLKQSINLVSILGVVFVVVGVVMVVYRST